MGIVRQTWGKAMITLRKFRNFGRDRVSRHTGGSQFPVKRVGYSAAFFK